MIIVLTILFAFIAIATYFMTYRIADKEKLDIISIHNDIYINKRNFKYFYVKSSETCIKKIYRIAKEEDYYLIYGYNIYTEGIIMPELLKYPIKIEQCGGFINNTDNDFLPKYSIKSTQNDLVNNTKSYYEILNDLLITNKDDVELLDRFEYMYGKLSNAYSEMLFMHSKHNIHNISKIGWTNLVYDETLKWYNEYINEISKINHSNDGSINVTEFLQNKNYLNIRIF